MYSLAHITHEAVEKIGGIGSVLEGLMTSPLYQHQVKRSILIGPIATHLAIDSEKRLGEEGRVLYSSIDQIDRASLGSRLRPVERAFNVALVYGIRTYVESASGRTGESEVLLVDVFGVNPDRLNAFKWRLWKTFGLDSRQYESNWDYEEYVRLAKPAFYALLALLEEKDYPCVVMGHEFMGMPTALATILEGKEKFRTVFYGHECATARRVVENHPGHDTMFYNLLEKASSDGLYLEDVFGSMDHHLRHALVSRAHLCDAIITVGEWTRREMQFLNERLKHCQIDVIPNGLPAFQIDLDKKLRSRRMLLDYSKALFGQEPQFLLTHVARPVISKGFWRDLKVASEMDRHFSEDRRWDNGEGDRGLQAVLYLLSTGGGTRRPQDILAMEHQYGWPRHHREGYPDLVGPELDIHRDVEAFNTNHHHVQVVLINQFGFSQSSIGRRLPAGMDLSDLRRATDVEFGMATYEPFGISPLEPLGCGAICVISSVCGCKDLIEQASPNGAANVIIADFTEMNDPQSIDQLTAMTSHRRDQIEQKVAIEVADRLMVSLPANDQQRHALLESGQNLMAAMSWDRVLETRLLPLLKRITTNSNTGD